MFKILKISSTFDNGIRVYGYDGSSKESYITKLACY